MLRRVAGNQQGMQSRLWDLFELCIVGQFSNLHIYCTSDRPLPTHPDDALHCYSVDTQEKMDRHNRAASICWKLQEKLRSDPECGVDLSVEQQRLNAGDFTWVAVPKRACAAPAGQLQGAARCQQWLVLDHVSLLCRVLACLHPLLCCCSPRSSLMVCSS